MNSIQIVAKGVSTFCLEHRRVLLDSAELVPSLRNGDGGSSQATREMGLN